MTNTLQDAHRHDPHFVAAPQKATLRWRGVIMPRETGAWPQVIVPVLTVALLAGWRPGALYVGALLLSLFFAHEPLMIIANLRGPRSRFENLRRSQTQMLVCLASSLLFFGLALAVGPHRLWISFAVPAFFGTLLAPFTIGRLEKTLPGELCAAAAMSSFAFPAGIAGGLSWQWALAVALVFGLSFSTAVFGVRRVTAKTFSATTRWSILSPIIFFAASFSICCILERAGHLPDQVSLALLPLCGYSLILTYRPPHLRHIRKVGVALTVCSIVNMVILIWLFHRG